MPIPLHVEHVTEAFAIVTNVDLNALGALIAAAATAIVALCVYVTRPSGRE